MTVETHAHSALARVERELMELERKEEALGAFADRVAGIETDQPGREQTAAMGGETVAGVMGRTGGDGCSEVRTAFAETVVPHSGDGDEPVVESIRAELGDEVALAVSTQTPATVTPGLRDRILAVVESRRGEIVVTRRALGGERAMLEESLDTVETVTDWLVEANGTPLSDLGFDALAARHVRLQEYRQVCTGVIETRQEHVHRTTSRGGTVGVGHRELVAYLYEDFPVGYPVLSTVIRLVGVVEDCKRAVRDHLVRRV